MFRNTPSRPRQVFAIGLFGLGLVSLVAIAGDAFARPGDHGEGGPRGHHRAHVMHMLKARDANNDGTVTRREAETYQANQLKEFDTDRSGSLTLAEFEALWLSENRRRIVRAFQRQDRDGDAVITKEEMDARIDHFFMRADRNGDGEISREDRPHGPGKGRRGRRGGRD